MGFGVYAGLYNSLLLLDLNTVLEYTILYAVPVSGRSFRTWFMCVSLISNYSTLPFCAFAFPVILRSSLLSGQI